MLRKLLILSVGLSVVGELAFALAGFFAPEWTLGLFKVSVAPETLFLGHVIAWFLLATAAVLGVATWQLVHDSRAGHLLTRVMGAWFVAIGLAIFLKFGRPDNLVLDTLRGAWFLGLSFVVGRETSG
jgi:hypothetical protein